MIRRAWEFLLLGLAMFASQSVIAQTHSFVLGGQLVTLEKTEPTVGAFLRAFRPNSLTGRWEVDLVVTNGSARTLKAPFVLRFDRADQVAPGIAGAQIDAEGLPFFEVSEFVRGGELGPGEVSPKLIVSLGDGKTRPIVAVSIYAQPLTPLVNMAAAQVLTADGAVLEGATTEEIGPTQARRFTAGRGGWFSLEVAEGVRGWKFSAPGHGPVIRLAPNGSQRVTELVSPRLAALVSGGPTVLNASTIPAPVPAGWSPLAAAILPAGSFNLELAESLEAGASGVLAKWDDTALGWRMVSGVVGTAGNLLTVNDSSGGTFVVLRADQTPVAPPTPTVGELLQGIPAPTPPATLTASGSANPASRSASRDPLLIQAEATVELISTRGPLSSGLEVPCEISEEYRLRDGTRRILPSYRTRLVGYQRPNSRTAGALVARFPLRPFQLLGGEELAEAIVRVEVLKPGGFTGGIFETSGGAVANGSTRIRAGSGDFVRPEAVFLQEIAIGDTNGIAPAALKIAKAFNFNVSAPQSGGRLSIELGPQTPNKTFVLARAIFDEGRHGFQPVQRFVSGTDGKLTSTEPTDGLAGIDGGGQFVLFETATAEGLVKGVVRDSSGAAKRGLAVRRGPWTAFSDAGGSFRLLAPAGANEVAASDPNTGDSGTLAIDVPTNLPPVDATVDSVARGPRIVSISPVNNATNVPRVASITINFNKALNPATIVGTGTQLLNATGGVVAASVTLNLAGNGVTIAPLTQLASAENHRVRIADGVSDLLGRVLEGDREFTFTTVNDTVTRGAAAQITIYEPGATNLTAELLSKIPAYDPKRDHDGIVIEGSQGTAEPRGSVILVNESSGETATISAAPDGSFVSTIRGSVQDFISAVIVNANGTRNQIPATRQKFDDGSIGLFAAGGIITSQGEGTPVDLIIDPGAVHGKTVFKVENVGANDFQALFNGKLPPGARPPLAAFNLTESGDELQAAGDISVPVKLADLGLPPGSDPTNFTFVVTRAVVRDGVPLHQIVDIASYESTGPEGGRVRTQSPPFVGMMERRLAALAQSAGLSTATPVKISQTTANSHRGQTATYGVMPMDANRGEKVGGFVRAVTKHEDGSETTAPLGGALVRMFRLQDENPKTTGVVIEGDMVSVSDEHGNFGFFFKPLVADQTRQLVAVHDRFPFQRARSGPFVTDRSGATQVRAELIFQELPPVAVGSDGSGQPVITVGHDPALPSAGTGPDDGATVFVSAVDDISVSDPQLEVTDVLDLNGNPLPSNEVTKTDLAISNDLQARKVAQFKITMKHPGRVVLNAYATDQQTPVRNVQHVIAFGLSRPAIPPGDPTDESPLRVVFAWPPPNGTNVPALMPITLRFNRSLPPLLLQPEQVNWLSFGASHTVQRVTATADRREVTVFYDGPTTGPVHLTVGPGIIGESGRDFDQNSLEQGEQAFHLDFIQSSGVSAELGDNIGAGAVMLGEFGYLLERKGEAGSLRVIDFDDPGDPQEIHNIRLRYPTAMSLIPQYSMPDGNGGCEKQNLLAIFSGTANEPKFLQLAKLDSGSVTLGPKLVMSGGGTDGNGRRSVAFNSTITESHSQIVRSRWDPPYLAYFELGADVTSIKLINLASFQKVAEQNGILDSFPVGQSDDGFDADGDGDFCGPDERAPTPDGDPLVAPGLAFSVAPKNNRERIQDFDFHAGLGVIFSISSFVAEEQHPRFSTLLSAGEANNLDNAFVEFTSSDSPRRLIFLPATTLETPATGRIVRDIAIVSLAQASGDGALAVIDVSTPSAPKLLNRFTLPDGEGTPASIQRRDDGLLAVTTSHSTLLVDPSKLTASNQQPTHPSIVGRIPTPGTGVRDFVADPTGINITYGGDARKYVETAPRFTVIRFANPTDLNNPTNIINPNVLAAANAEDIRRFLNFAVPVDIAEVTLSPNGETPAAADPSRHYYVIADIPGGAADFFGKLRFALSAVDANGMPAPELGGTVVPAIVGDEQLESALISRKLVDLFFAITRVKKTISNIAQAQTAVSKIKAALGDARRLKKAVEKFTAFAKTAILMPDKFEARRLSNDPDDPLYNKFLAGPFVILGGAPTFTDLSHLKTQAESMGVDRAYLRPSTRLWVGLPSERVGGLIASVNPFTPPQTKLRPFVSELRLNPSASILGINIPLGREAIEQVARVNSSPANPFSSFLDFGQQITLVVSLLNNAPFVKLVASGEWQPMLIPGAHRLVRVNFADRPVVLVPGFAGSKLEINGQNEWLGFPNALFLRDRLPLRMNIDGTPSRPTFATDAVRYALETPIIDLQPIYGDWIDHMTAELGLIEYDFKHQAGLPLSASGPEIQSRLAIGPGANLGQSPVPNLYVFPYDWRQDNQLAATNLAKYVKLALEMHPDADGIDLVAHSNGGLVSRAYMQMPGQTALVKRFVTVGTPWLGAPKALSGMRLGDIDEAALNVLVPIPGIRAMLQFAPGAHQLLPSSEYFDLGYRPLVEDGFDINTNGFPNEVYDFNKYMDALAHHFLRKPVEELHISYSIFPNGEHPVRKNANGFRLNRGIGDHSKDHNDVEVHHIVGMGAVADTIGQLRVRARLVAETNRTNVTVSLARMATFESEQVRDGAEALVSLGDGKLAVNETNQFRLSEEIEVRYVAGDGTVPIGSLVRGFGAGAGKDLNAPGAQLHPIVGGHEDKFTGHNPMLAESEFFDVFDDIYVGRKRTNIDLFISANDFTEGSSGTISVTGSPPPGASPQISYVVDFGDGGVELKNANSFETAQVQHRYRQSGDYMVTVGASAGNEVYGISSHSIHVANVPPDVTITGLDAQVNLGDSRIAIAKVRDPGLDDRHSFLWTTPDGGASGFNQFAVPITFNTPGDQIIKVDVTDTDGESGHAEFTVHVLPQPSGVAGPNFGTDPAAQNNGTLAQAPIQGFEGGHPEIIVRFNGQAPNTLDTVGVSVRQEGVGSDILGGVFDILNVTPVANDVNALLNRVVFPIGARFLGKLAENSEYARLVRELPSEFLSIDTAATRAVAAAAGNGGPIEIDVLYIEGGTPKVLHRWNVPRVLPTEGVRLKFDWVLLEGTVERVLNDPNLSIFDVPAIATVPPIFSGFGEQKAGDRSGPATLGILNPATEILRVLARDNLTPEANISLFAAFDANENGRFDDDVFYPLDTNVVNYARLPKRPFVIVGVDEQGNVGGLDPFTLAETRNFLVDKDPNQSQSEYEKKLREIRDAVRAAITEARGNSVVQTFLLHSDDLWIFEQGSGANLWKPDFLNRCNGLYIPGKSDNDYELFLPVQLGNPYPFTEQGRVRFTNDGPYSEVTLRGDWYFQRPTGLDSSGAPTEDDQAIVQWRFTTPDGAEITRDRLDNDDDLDAGFRSPLTPAEIIARMFTKAVTDDQARRKLLPDTTFFPERREHFMFGQLHLERPPEFGDDPIGDAGTGRQMLMLKWLMEGAYVTSDDNGSSFSPGAPRLSDIFPNWKAAGVPLAEGFEWGVFQDFAALKSKPFQVLSVRLSSHGENDNPRLVNRYYDDAALVQQASRIKKLGKAAIRATLARLAGDSNLNAVVAGVPAAKVIDNPERSFENFVLELARSSDETRAAFGDFALRRNDITEPPDLGDFLRAKNADRAYLTTILTTPGSYERFVATTFQFLRTVVQAPTRQAYTNHLETLRQRLQTDELGQRQSNMDFIALGRGPNQPGLLALNTDRRISRTPIQLAVETYSPGDAGQAQVTFDHSEDTPTPAPLKKKRQSLAPDPTPAGVIATIASVADDDQTIADGESVSEGSAIIDPTDERTEISEASVVTGSAIDTTSEDNTIVVEASAINPALPAPVISDNPIIMVAVRPAPGEDMFPLEDWPAANGRPRSARYWLRRSDELSIALFSPPGLPPFNVTIASESEASSFPREVLLTDPEGIGAYKNNGSDNLVQFINRRDPSQADRIHVKDEELLTIHVTGNGLDKQFQIMVDLGEISLATLQHHDRLEDRKPRYDYTNAFVNLSNPSSFNFELNGFVEFPDDVAGSVLSGDNPMRHFIQNFAEEDPALSDEGEADILYIHSHGTASGKLIDHFFENAPPGIRGVIVDPATHLAPSGFWRSDAEWAILDACSTLNPDPTASPGLTPGRFTWEMVLTNLNGDAGRRMPHGILGFEDTKKADRPPHVDFINGLHNEKTFISAWRTAMTRAHKPWAALYFASAGSDTIREISQDPLATDRVVYIDTENPTAEGCDDCAEEDVADPFVTIATPATAHIDDWSRAEEALRQAGYRPEELWRRGVSNERQTDITPAGASEPRTIATAYHWEKPLRDPSDPDANIAVRVAANGRPEIFDGERIASRGRRR